jgi:hypothetical protein
MTTTLTLGADRVLLMDTAFSAGFMRDRWTRMAARRAIFGPAARPSGRWRQLRVCRSRSTASFAYTMNQMEPGVLPNAKSLRLVEALYAA